ncbi:MAG: hypothetical protein ABL889_16705, partial [Terricaulis sp.]
MIESIGGERRRNSLQASLIFKACGAARKDSIPVAPTIFSANRNVPDLFSNVFAGAFVLPRQR